MANEPPWGLEVPLGIDSDGQWPGDWGSTLDNEWADARRELLDWWGTRRQDVVGARPPMPPPEHRRPTTDDRAAETWAQRNPVETGAPTPRTPPRHVLVMLDLNDALGRTMCQELIHTLGSYGRWAPAEELRTHLQAAHEASANREPETTPEGADDGR